MVRGICQIEKYSCSFFSNEGSFSHLFDSLNSSRIEPNYIIITDSWIISGWKRQGQMKQEVRSVGKFSASTPSSGSN